MKKRNIINEMRKLNGSKKKNVINMSVNVQLESVKTQLIINTISMSNKETPL